MKSEAVSKAPRERKEGRQGSVFSSSFSIAGFEFNASFILLVLLPAPVGLFVVLHPFLPYQGPCRATLVGVWEGEEADVEAKEEKEAFLFSEEKRRELFGEE